MPSPPRLDAHHTVSRHLDLPSPHTHRVSNTKSTQNASEIPALGWRPLVPSLVARSRWAHRARRMLDLDTRARLAPRTSPASGVPPGKAERSESDLNLVAEGGLEPPTLGL